MSLQLVKIDLSGGSMKFEIFANYNFLQSLDRLLNQKMSMPAAYKLKTIKNSIMEEFSKYEDMRQDLIKQFAKKDDAGNVVRNNDPEKSAVFEGGNDKLFINRVKELHQVEFLCPHKIKLSDLEHLSLTPQDVINLGNLIEE
jgi:hypothetical protein